MKLVHKYEFLGSSVDPKEVALTFKGVGASIVVIIVAVAGIAGVPVVEADLIQLVNLLAGIASSLVIVAGLLRKTYVAIKKHFNK